MKSGKVLTNVGQSLSDGEKRQARANIDAARTNPSLFVQPVIYSGTHLPSGGGSAPLYLKNITNQHTLVLIGLKPSGCYHVNAWDTYEVVTDGLPSFGTANFSMGLFKMVGHPLAGSSGTVTFRRLTMPLSPRPLTGIRNDGVIPPYGFSPVASNPLRFTLNEDADFDNGELIYLGIAVAYDSDVPNDDPVFVGAFPLLPVYDYNNPITVVNPVYYAQGQSDKIGPDGFIAREFTIGYSPDGDFTYTSGFSSSMNILIVSSGGISESTGKTYPCGIKLIKYDASRDTVKIGGRTYKTVTIGGKTWLAENLDYKFSGLVVGQGSSTSEARANYYNDDEATYGVHGNKYGLLYNWVAVKYLEDHKSLLIPGWHIPTTTEWDALATAVGGSSVAGTKLKSTTGWSSGNGDGSYGFAVFPAGSQGSGSFFDLGSYGSFWTATEDLSSNAYIRSFSTGPSMSSYSTYKSYGYSVRLVKD